MQILSENSMHTGGSKMLDNQELPIGFTMELAEHSEALNRFAQLSKDEQQWLVDGAKNVNSREEMRTYVEHMF